MAKRQDDVSDTAGREIAKAIDRFAYSDHRAKPVFEQYSNGERRRGNSENDVEDNRLFDGVVTALENNRDC